MSELPSDVEALKALVQEHERERARLTKQVNVLEAECKRYLDQFVDVEMQNAAVSNLYVASFRLHGTLDKPELVTIMQEIVINLIGSEEIAIYEVDEAEASLVLVSTFGIRRPLGHRIQFGEGLIGQIAQTGKLYVAGEGEAAKENLTACIPLVLGGKTLAVIAIYRLLEHKRALEHVDHQLFDLLSRQGAVALYCTKLHAHKHQEALEAKRT